MAPRRLLVFDLDGTLVDSLPDLGAALNRLMAARGLPDFAPKEIAAMIGDGTKILVGRAFAARGRASTTADLDTFLADYTAHAAVATRPYPGVTKTLATLRQAGWRFAICTNKTVAATKVVLKALDLESWFDAIGGGDSFAAHKPDPAHLVGTIAAAGGRIEDAIMTGDHANDVAVAKAVGIPAIFAAWGYGAPGMAAGATATAQHFTDLQTLAPQLLTR
jgi:phosphoglycolate phosphatase